MVNLQGRKLHKNISVMVSWNVSIRKASKGILFLMKDGKDPWENMNINQELCVNMAYLNSSGLKTTEKLLKLSLRAKGVCAQN